MADTSRKTLASLLKRVSRWIDGRKEKNEYVAVQGDVEDTLDSLKADVDEDRLVDAFNIAAFGANGGSENNPIMARDQALKGIRAVIAVYEGRL